MRESRLYSLIGLLILAGGLVAVFALVLEIRFAGGEIYPHYSTQRSDPLGAMAIYESFQGLPEKKVARNFENLMSIRSLDGDATLWLCGLSRGSFESFRGPDESPVLQAVRDSGARLVISLNPELVPKRYDLKEEEKEDEWWEKRKKAREAKTKKKEAEKAKEQKAAPDGEKAGDTESDGKRDKEKDPPKDPAEKKGEEKQKRERIREEDLGPLLTSLFGVEATVPGSFERPDGGWELKRTRNTPASIPKNGFPRWNSQLRFEELDKSWRVIARIGNEPVVIERPFGKGTIAMTSGAFFASNEALWLEPAPEFLSWLAGDKPRLVFDETIHGTVESGGVMKLMRQFRLHGFFFGLALFVGLLAWKSGASLAPGSESLERGLVREGEDAVAGEDSARGLVHLLRRSLPARRLIAECLAAHRSASAVTGARTETAGQTAAINGILSIHENRPREMPAPEAYRRISHVLAHPDDYRDSPPHPPP